MGKMLTNSKIKTPFNGRDMIFERHGNAPCCKESHGDKKKISTQAPFVASERDLDQPNYCKF